MTYAEASKCFRVSKETVKRIVKGAKQNSDSRDTPSKRKLSRSSLNGRACSIIVGLLQENSSITLRLSWQLYLKRIRYLPPYQAWIAF